VASLYFWDAFQELLQSEEAAEAMKYDGVHPDTLCY
jgi:hypothetical protein